MNVLHNSRNTTELGVDFGPTLVINVVDRFIT